MTSPKYGYLAQDGQWKVLLTDCQSGDPYNVSNIDPTEIYMNFKKVDGTKFSVAAELQLENTTYYIVYTNSAPDESILDQKGFWQNWASFKLTDSAYVPTSQRTNFRVG